MRVGFCKDRLTCKYKSNNAKAYCNNSKYKNIDSQVKTVKYYTSVYDSTGAVYAYSNQLAASLYSETSSGNGVKLLAPP